MTKEHYYKIGLMVFGLTLFPAFLHAIGRFFLESTTTIAEFYSYFYGSLLDMGMDGLVVWAIACGPYLIYEIVLVVKSFLPKTDMKERSEAND
jgi:hypothetical protein